MATHILVNGLGLTRKGTVGASLATIPDICKTPTPGGPVPIPYPNFADQGSLDKGTTTVKAKGSMIAIKGSEYCRSSGDEPGTAGGITSSTFKKETAWISYSFDVKMDGANTCRHTDKKFHNHKNTVDLAGNLDPTMPLVDLEKELVEIAKECEEEVENDPDHKQKSCQERGTAKHDCCDRKIQERTPNDKPQGIFSDGAFDRQSGEMIGRNNPVRGGVPSRVPRTRGSFLNQARGYAATFGTDFIATRISFLSDKKFPDVVVSSDATLPPGPGNTKAVYDFKFPCPKEKKPRWGDDGNQGDIYNEMLSPQRAPKMISPAGVF